MAKSKDVSGAFHCALAYWITSTLLTLALAELRRLVPGLDYHNCSEHEPAMEQASTGELERLRDIHVVYGSTAHDFRALFHSTVSLIANAKSPENLRIHWIAPETDMDTLRTAAACLGRELASMGPKPQLVLHAAFPVPFATRQSLPQDVADLQGARMLLQKYLGADVQRAIWLDTDTIVQTDVGELYRRRMSSPISAQKKSYGSSDRIALQDLAAIWDPRAASLFRDSEFQLFGTGVFLADLRDWRQQDAARNQRLVEWSQAFPMGHGYDQILMNIEFQDTVDVLDWRWNVDRIGVCAACIPRECISQARIVHWSGPHKPWRRKNTSRIHHVHDGIFKRYAPRSRCSAWVD